MSDTEITENVAPETEAASGMADMDLLSMLTADVASTPVNGLLEEGDAASEPTQEAEPEAKVEESVDAKAEPAKEGVLQLKSGDKVTDVTEDTTVEVKVDGKLEHVTLKDLKRNYQGRVPWERHYQETKQLESQLRAKEQSFENRVKEHDSKLQEVLEVFAQNPFKAFEKIALLKGENPARYLPIYIAQAQKTVEELNTLTEAQKDALIMRKEAEYDREEIKREKARIEQENKLSQSQREVQEVDAHMDAKCKELGISQDELSNAIEVIKGSGVNLKDMPLKKVADLTLDYIVNIDRVIARIEKAVETEAPSMRGNDKFVGAIKQLVDASFSESDIVDIIRGYIGSETPKPKAEAKQTPVVQKKPTATSPSATPMNERRDARTQEDVGPLTFEDLLRA